MQISLIGLPGSGKSTIGRHLAKRLGAAFFDSDQVIEQQLGCSIRAYFEHHGEEAFREVESVVIDQLTQQAHAVLSTGGGAVLKVENRQYLRDRTYVVYLRSSPDELFKRLRHDMTRPLLQVADPLGRLREMHAVRDPLYAEAAHFTIETGRPSVSTVIHLISEQLERTSRSSS